MGRLAVILFALLCFGMAGGTYVVAVHQPTQTMQRAEPVDGVVTSTEVASQSTDNGNQYYPVVTYEYQFDGQTYTNDDYSLVGGAPAGSPGRAEEFLEDYTAGQQVTVYVVPGNPSNSFLRRGSAGLTIYAVVGALGLLGALGLAALVADLLGVEAVDIK